MHKLRKSDQPGNGVVPFPSFCKYTEALLVTITQQPTHLPVYFMEGGLFCFLKCARMSKVADSLMVMLVSDNMLLSKNKEKIKLTKRPHALRKHVEVAWSRSQRRRVI
eukprot:scaffold163557_cov15-Tisochrysis_lutea.AAC.1